MQSIKSICLGICPSKLEGGGTYREGAGGKKFPLFKMGGGGHNKLYPVIEGGGAHKVSAGDFPI